MVRLKNFQSKKKYDLIISIHSFYFMKNAVKSSQKALRFLKSGGHLAIVLHAKDGFGRRLIREFDHAGIQGGATAEWLHEQLGSSCDISFVESNLPYKEFVDGDGLSARGRAYVAFYAYRNWTTFSPAERQRAREVIEECSDGKIIREKFGMLHLRGTQNHS
jgi:SAM-dependent methyltransferase